jgi:hypothetical protein
MSSKHSSDSEFRLVPLAEDIEYQAARAAVTNDEKAMLAAEERYRLAQTPAEERMAWKAVEEARKALAKARENPDEVKGRKSAEVCTAVRAEQQGYLRELLEGLEDVEGAATFETRLAI